MNLQVHVKIAASSSSFNETLSAHRNVLSCLTRHALGRRMLRNQPDKGCKDAAVICIRMKLEMYSWGNCAGQLLQMYGQWHCI